MTTEQEIDYNIEFGKVNPAWDTPLGVVSPLLELQKAETIQLRKWLFYLVERVPIDADPRLVEITQYIQPFAKRGDFKE